MCRKANKLLGGNPLQTALVEQWANWSTTTLQPTIDHVLLGVFGGDENGIQVQQAHWNEA